MKMNPRTFRWFVVAAALAVAAGCSQSDSASTQTAAAPGSPAPAQPSSQPPALPPGHPTIEMSGQALPAAAMAQGSNPQWTVPTGWQPGQTSSMRRGSWMVSGADGQSAEIAVSAFPGDVGGLLANINRWRQQIGMAPVMPDQVASLASNLDVNGTTAIVVDFTAEKPPAGKTQPQRMVVVTLPHATDSWFFKLTGDAPVVDAQKETLLQFVKSVKF